MSALSGSRNGFRILFLGLPFGVSATFLRRFITSQRVISGVIIPGESVPHFLGGSSSPVTLLEPPTGFSFRLEGLDDVRDTIDIAWRAGLPVWAVTKLKSPEFRNLLEAIGSDIGLVACFTRRIPPAILQVPRFGFLNYHPSLLPAYRGPVPLFWQLRDGAPTGVTIHYLDEGLDTGDIVAQTKVGLPEGCSGYEADMVLARAAGELLDDVLNELAGGVVNRQPQPQGGSYFSFPELDDFTLSMTWPALRAYNFMRGTGEWGRPYRLALEDESIWLSEAIHCDPHGSLARAYERTKDLTQINFSPGVLVARELRNS